MPENKTAPEIRFAGYTEPWQERRLGEVLQEIGAGKSKFSINEKTAVFCFEILGSTSVIGYDDSFDYDGEFILTARVGANAGTLYRHKGKVKISDNTVYLKGENLDFIQALLTKFDLTKLSFGTGQPLIKSSELRQLDVIIPRSLAEQQQIGEFFRTLDEAITLRQRKLEGLRELKRGYLQQMFPKAGERVPRVRFAGFDGEWQERKLGEVADVKMCRRIFNEETSASGDIPFYKIGTFGGKADAYITQEKFEEYKEKYPYPEIGDVLISAAGTIGRTVVYRGEKEYFQDSNIVWLKTDKTKLTNIFLEQFYEITDWSGIEGTTIKRLYNANILATMIKLPSLAEQTKIGEFFRALDGQITVQAEKVEQLKRMKAAYLQKMFV